MERWEHFRDWCIGKIVTRSFFIAIGIVIVLVAGCWLLSFYLSPNRVVTLCVLRYGQESSQTISCCHQVEQLEIEFSDWRRDDQDKISANVTSKKDIPSKIGLFVQLRTAKGHILEESELPFPSGPNQIRRVVIYAPHSHPGYHTYAPVDEIRIVQAEIIDFHKEIQAGLMKATIRGHGLSSVDIEMVRHQNKHYVTVIPTGTMFIPTSHKQPMLVVENVRFLVTERKHSEDKYFGTIPVACADMDLEAPGQTDVLATRMLQKSDRNGPELLALLSLPAFTQADGYVRQFALWTITNNPPIRGFKSISSCTMVMNTSISYPPETMDKRRLALIKGLFNKAGIDTSKYQALGETR